MAPKKPRFASWEAAAKTPMELRLQSGLVTLLTEDGMTVDWLVHWVGLGATWGNICRNPWRPHQMWGIPATFPFKF